MLNENIDVNMNNKLLKNDIIYDMPIFIANKK